MTVVSFTFFLFLLKVAIKNFLKALKLCLKAINIGNNRKNS